MIRRAPELETLFDIDVRVMRHVPGSGARELRAEEAAVVTRSIILRREEFAAGRECAHGALEALGAPDIPLLPGKDRAPIWPRGFVGSISHSNGMCAAVAAKSNVAASVGLDVEINTPLSTDIRSAVCLIDEIAYHKSLPEICVDWALLTFCVKEAFYKAYYPLTGQFLDFHDVSTRLTPQAGGRSGTFRASLADAGLPNAERMHALSGRWTCEGDWIWAAFACPA